MKTKYLCLLMILIAILVACAPASIPAANTQEPTEAPTAIPATVESSATSIPTIKKYIVKTGETCSMIAADHQITLDQFTQMNPGYKCSGIKAGDILTIPVLSEDSALNASKAQLLSIATATVVVKQANTIAVPQYTKAPIIAPTAKPPVVVQPTSPPAAGGIDPSKPTALCKDGTYSYSKHRSGTCSGHGGVKQWLQNIP